MLIVMGTLGLVVDSAGNVIVGGEFEGTIDFGDGPRTSAAGAVDDFVLSLDPSGGFRWVRTFGSSGSDLLLGMEIDADQIAVAGHFTGSLTAGTTTLTAVGGNDIYVLRYSAGGTLIRADRYGGAGNETAHDVAIVGNDVTVVGTFDTSSNLGTGPLTSAGQADVFVARYNDTGAATMVQTFGGTGYEVAWGVAATSSRIVIAGAFETTVNFGPRTVTSAGGRDVFVLGMDIAGGARSLEANGGTAYDEANDVVVDTRGIFYAAGHIEGTFDVGNGPVATQSNDPFLVTVGSTGMGSTQIWPGPGSESVTRLAVRDDGSLTLLGGASGTIEFDGVTVGGGMFLVTVSP
jgi:hypothetical protein